MHPSAMSAVSSTRPTILYNPPNEVHMECLLVGGKKNLHSQVGVTRSDGQKSGQAPRSQSEGNFKNEGHIPGEWEIKVHTIIGQRPTVIKTA